MKILNTLIYLIGFQYMASAQTPASIPPQPDKNEQAGLSFFVTTPAAGTERAKLTPSDETRYVIITNIPANNDKMLTSVNIQLDMVGAFAFKRNSALTIPANKEVFIEDKLNGRIFNLKTSGSYKFNVDQWVANRFVMHILDKGAAAEESSVVAR